MKKAKIAFFVLLVLGLITGVYLTGYHVGQRDEDRTHLHLRIDKEVYLYREAKSGDFAAVKSSLEISISDDYNFYETHYVGENWSPTTLEAARQIATLAATNGSLIRVTNSN